MIILLYGEDTYRQKKKLAEIMEEHREKHKSGLNLRRLEGKNASFEDLKNEMLGISMFKEKKLIVVSDLFSNQKLKEDLLEKGDAFIVSDNVLLLSEQSKILNKDKLLSFLEEKGQTLEFELLSGAKLKAWARKEVEKEEGSISDEAMDKLLEYVGSDLWRLENEIAKLANYSKSISAEAVEELVRPDYELNIFDAVDAIAFKDKKKAVSLLRSHLDKGESAIYLLAMIASQIRNILSVKGSSGAPAGMHSFVYRKSLLQAKNFSMDDLKRIYNRLAGLDLEIKTGKIDQDMALDVLISEI